MKKIFSILAIITLISPIAAYAVCPVCTVAVGAGLGLAEWLGIDDSISGLWIGALIVSISIWTINWLNKKGLTFSFRPDVASGLNFSRSNLGRDILIFVAYYAIVILPLWLKGKIGHPFHQICGIDKLLFGIILGSVLFTAGILLHNYLRKRNGNVSYFKGQKIALAVLPLIIASLNLYFIC